jgi:hypothetical protein
MAKGIKIHGYGRLRGEFLFKESSAEQYLPYEGFPGRHIAVRLKIPTSHDMPLPRSYKLLDSLV